MFDAIKPWNMGAQQFGQTSGSDGAQPIYNQVGRDGISPELAKFIGYTPPAQSWGGVDSGVQQQDPVQAFTDFLTSKGLHLGQQDTGNNQAIQQLFDANNNPVGQQFNANLEQDPGGLFRDAVLGMTAFGGASALGAFGGGAAGASGAPAGSGGLAGTGLPEYSGAYAGGTPYALAGDVAAAPEGAFAGGADLASNPFGAIDATGGGAAGAATAGGGAGGGVMSSLNSGIGDVSSWMKANPGLTNVGGGILNGLIGAYQSNKALDAQQNATNQANALWAPYRDLGNAGAAGYKNLLQNPGSITSDPGYQFGLNQGVQGVDRSAASKGGLYSGATLKALDRYGQDYGGTKLNEAFGRYGNAAQIGATGTSNTSNNITNLGNAQAGQNMYMGNVLQNGVNNALGQFNFSNGGYGGGQNPFNQSTYVKAGTGP